MGQPRGGIKLRRCSRKAASYKAQFLRTERNKARRKARNERIRIVANTSGGGASLRRHRIANRLRRLDRWVGTLAKMDPVTRNNEAYSAILKAYDEVCALADLCQIRK